MRRVIPKKNLLSAVTAQADWLFIDNFFRGIFGCQGRPARALAIASHGSVPFFGGGAEVGSDAAEFDGARFGAESAGDFLLRFHLSSVGYLVQLGCWTRGH